MIKGNFKRFKYIKDFLQNDSAVTTCWVSFTREVNSWLAKRPLVFNRRLGNRGLISLVKEATGICHASCSLSLHGFPCNSQWIIAVLSLQQILWNRDVNCKSLMVSHLHLWFRIMLYYHVMVWYSIKFIYLKNGWVNTLVMKNDIAFNTLRLKQNGRHFPENIFNCIFLNENI